MCLIRGATAATSLILVHDVLAAKDEMFFTPEHLVFADINGDGLVDPVDASLILVYNSYRANEGTLSLSEWFKSLPG